ncbi:hypothetical protein [Streptomyces sp. NPDC086787]|uniref:hypothetical protein n=1 Tax=Streptomyces sp. NPDC086787 TaxID=3365759 RepID=UPI003809F46B
MYARRVLALTLVVSVMALTGACTEDRPRNGEAEARRTASAAAPTHSWDGKEEEEDAIRRATRALGAVRTEGVSRVDEGLESLARGLDRTFTGEGDHPYTFDVACQAPDRRSVTLTLARGDTANEWEVTCGDREADRFNIPAGGRFTARITKSGPHSDGFVMWRLNTVAPQDVDGCKDDITGCEK